LIIEPCANRGPARDNPYYRGLGCVDFSEQRRPGGADGIIGGFSPIALKINDPRRGVQLAPAHCPRCISLAHCRNSHRIDETEIGTGACHLRIPTQSVFKSGGTLETSAGRAPTFAAASSRQTCLPLQLPSELLEEPGCPIREGFVPHIVRFGRAAKASIFPKSGPIARIHFVFRIDQIL
jgi:hypothetical protein